MWLPSDDDELIGKAVLDLLIARNAVEQTRAGADDPAKWNRSLWQELLGMGIAELSSPDMLGAQLCAAESLGRAPVAAPVLAQTVLLPALIDSETTTTVAIGPFDASGTLVSAPDDIVTGDGTLTWVLGASWAERIVFPHAATGRVLAVQTADPAVTVHPRRSLDVTHPFADVRLCGATVTEVGELDRDGLVRANDAGRLWLIAGMVGTAQQLLVMALSHAATRVQFGMPIARRQAIKHKCADMAIEIESARSALWAAIGSRSALDLATARLAASRATGLAAQHSFQIHGGIGFTWEHDLHLLFKRAQVARTLFGGDAWARGLVHQNLLELM